MDTTWFGEERRKPNTLQIAGNAATMNLNNLILTNITNSPYFKGQLAELKTYHEVIDEIYYKVKHLEPWEKGSRSKGQTGMCGGVRGVGAGGIISTAFCLLYKLYALKLTRKQLVGLLNHTDSPYIRGLGFMYVRFTQPPADLWEWFEPYLNDPEEVDVRAGGGQVITIGEMVRLFLTKLDWFSSLFPRIPVPIQMGIDRQMAAKHATSLEVTSKKIEEPDEEPPRPSLPRSDYSRGESSNSFRPRRSRSRSRSPPPRREKRRNSSSPRHHRRHRDDSRDRSRSPKSSHSRRRDDRRDRDYHR